MSNPRSPMISLPLPVATTKSLWYSGAEKCAAIRPASGAGVQRLELHLPVVGDHPALLNELLAVQVDAERVRVDVVVDRERVRVVRR